MSQGGNLVIGSCFEAGITGSNPLSCLASRYFYHIDMRLSPLLRTLAEPPALNSVRQMLKQAMRDQQALQKQTYRAVIAAVKNANIAKPGSVVSDVSLASVVVSLRKKRLDAAAEYMKGNRADLADVEKQEAGVLDEVLRTLDLASPEEVAASVSKLVRESGIKTMKEAMQKLPKDVETSWRAPKSLIVQQLREILKQ